MKAQGSYPFTLRRRLPIGLRQPSSIRDLTTRSVELSDFVHKTGAGEGIRTLDPNLGKVVLYP